MISPPGVITITCLLTQTCLPSPDMLVECLRFTLMQFFLQLCMPAMLMLDSLQVFMLPLPLLLAVLLVTACLRPTATCPLQLAGSIAATCCRTAGWLAATCCSIAAACCPAFVLCSTAPCWHFQPWQVGFGTCAQFFASAGVASLWRPSLGSAIAKSRLPKLGPRLCLARCRHRCLHQMSRRRRRWRLGLWHCLGLGAGRRRLAARGW